MAATTIRVHELLNMIIIFIAPVLLLLLLVCYLSCDLWGCDKNSNCKKIIKASSSNVTYNICSLKATGRAKESGRWRAKETGIEGASESETSAAANVRLWTEKHDSNTNVTTATRGSTAATSRRQQQHHSNTAATLQRQQQLHSSNIAATRQQYRSNNSNIAATTTAATAVAAMPAATSWWVFHYDFCYYENSFSQKKRGK